MAHSPYQHPCEGHGCISQHGGTWSNCSEWCIVLAVLSKSLTQANCSIHALAAGPVPCVVMQTKRIVSCYSRRNGISDDPISGWLGRVMTCSKPGGLQFLPLVSWGPYCLVNSLKKSPPVYRVQLLKDGLHFPRDPRARHPRPPPRPGPR